MAKNEKKENGENKVEVTIKSKIMGHAPEEHHFVLADGKKLKSIFDLTQSLEKMGEDVFKHHVSEHKNDFSNWINDVFDMPDLAKEFKSMNNKIDAELSLLRKIADEVGKR